MPTMEYLKLFCLVMCFVSVWSEKTWQPNRTNDNNISHIEVILRPINKKMPKSEVSYNQHAKHRLNKTSQVVNTTENKMTIVNGMFNLLQNIGINLSTKQSNKLYNFIPYPLSGQNTVFRILIFPKNCTQLNITPVLPDDTTKNKRKSGTKNNSTYYYGNEDDSTRRITLLDPKDYKVKNALLEKTLNSLPEVEHGSFQSGITIHIKADTHKVNAHNEKKNIT